MKGNTENIKKRYNRMAPVFDLLEKPMDGFSAKWRQDIISEVSGTVLEVGAGTAKIFLTTRT